MTAPTEAETREAILNDLEVEVERAVRRARRRIASLPSGGDGVQPGGAARRDLSNAASAAQENPGGRRRQ